MGSWGPVGGLSGTKPAAFDHASHAPAPARGAAEPAGLALSRDDVVLHATATQQRAPGGYAASAHSRPADLTGEAAVLDLRAAVHDDLQAGGLRLGGGHVIAHAKLHPHNLDAKFVL